MGKKILILTGGGAKGSFQAGVIEQLYKTGWRADVVMGVSVGALNGAMVATGKWSQLTPLWRNINPGMVMKKRGPVRTGWRYLLHKAGLKKPTLGYYDNRPLFETLKKNMGEKFTTGFYCGALHLNSGLYLDFIGGRGEPSAPYVDEIIASTAIPLVFDPVVMGDGIYVDGGVKHSSPIGSALKWYEPDEVVIISCTRYTMGLRTSWTTHQPVSDMIDIAKLSLSAMMDEIAQKDIREFSRINALVEQAQKQGAALINSHGRRYKVYPARLYQPTESLGDALNFYPEQARRNIELGLNAKPIQL